MKKVVRRAMATGLCATLAVSALAMTGCSKKDNNKAGGGDGDKSVDVTFDIPKDTEGDISIMLWAGDSKYYEDIGHMGLTKDDITSQNVAAVAAVATAFNKTYPNIKINLWAKANDPNQEGTPPWDQEIENFKTQYGKYPDLWASTDVPNDIKKGIVADLSRYKDDATYKRFNQTMMGYMNYYGFQGGLPSYSIPWGVWVNKSLAKSNNIEVPDPDWDIDEYTEFATSGDGETFWGSMNCPTSFIETGCKDINAMISGYESGDKYVDLTTDAVKELLEYIPEWATDSVNAQLGLGNVPQEIADECGNYSYNYFCNNRILTLDADPWQLTAAADPDAVGGMGTVQAADWDIYPRPSTDYAENTVGMVVDPICLHNYALDDGNTEWSDEEVNKLNATYVFATYWTASTEAKQAIADMQYKSGRNYKSALSDSFPVVTGEEYDKQMEIWYSIPSHERYKDESKMPGFQEVVRIFGEQGSTWDYSDKCFPCTITENGEKVDCLYEWKNMWDGNVAGSYQTEPNWANDVKTRLSDWNDAANERFSKAGQQLQEALKKYYGFTDEAFK